MMEENNNHHQENKSKKLELEWKDYISLKAAELVGWKNYMSVSEAELQWKKQISMTLQELLGWKKFIPIGYRFVPTDYELLKYYLLAKVHGGFNLPGMGLAIIQEADVYQCQPANLPGLDKGEEFCYFFTTRYHRYENSMRPARSTKDGMGCWKMTSKRAPPIKDDESDLGRKNTLVYYLSEAKDVHSNKGIKTNWKMHEYVLDESLYDSTQVPSTSTSKPKQLVLCRIYKRKNKAAKEEKVQTEDSRSSQIRDTDDSSVGFEKKVTPTKRKQCSKITPEKGTSSCNNHKSVARFDQEELPSSQLKRSRPSTEDNGSMSLNDSTSSYDPPQVSQISLQLHQQEKSRILTSMEEKCELSTNCKTESRQLLENNGHHDFEEIIHDEEEDESRIGFIEENESENLMTSVNEVEEGDESQMIFGHVKEENESNELPLANASAERNSTEVGRMEGSQAAAEPMSGDCISTLTSLPAIQRHSSSDISSEASFIRGDTRQ